MRVTIPKAVWLFAAVSALGAAPVNGQETIASAETNWEGVVLEVTSVQRKGQVLTVKWTLRNQGGSRASVSFGTFDGGGYIADTYVIDEERGTKYFVLLDEGNRAVAGDLKFSLETGKKKRVWAKFPAPPPEVTAVTLIFNETEPLEEVPISDK